MSDPLNLGIDNAQVDLLPGYIEWLEQRAIKEAGSVEAAKAKDIEAFRERVLSYRCRCEHQRRDHLTPGKGSVECHADDCTCDGYVGKGFFAATMGV